MVREKVGSGLAASWCRGRRAGLNARIRIHAWNACLSLYEAKRSRRLVLTVAAGLGSLHGAGTTHRDRWPVGSHSCE